MVLGRWLLSLTFLSQQSFGYCPRAKRSRSNTRAGLVGYLFEMAHNACVEPTVSTRTSAAVARADEAMSFRAVRAVV
jgi:hypothetical protein